MKNDLGVQVIVPPKAVVRAMFERCLDALADDEWKPTPATVNEELLEIGAEWRGGIYAGLTIHDDMAMALVLLPVEAERVKWQDAGAWAEKAGGELPSRLDQLILYKNLKSEFKDSWYWSSEVHSGNADWAWVQGFGYGYQYGNLKGNELSLIHI